jgi:DNA-binding GntR family transcriptional regulator
VAVACGVGAALVMGWMVYRASRLAAAAAGDHGLHESTTRLATVALPTAAVVAALLQKSDRYTRVQLSSNAARKRAEKEHANLIEAAKLKKIKPACDLLVKHIETVRADLLTLLAKNK